MSALGRDDPTPVHCSTEFFLLNRGYAWWDVYKDFLAKWKFPVVEPDSFPIDDRDLLTRVQTGEIRLDWCVPGVKLDTLVSFFEKYRGMEVVMPKDALHDLRVDEGAWLVSENDNGADSGEFASVKSSGFVKRVQRPNAVQLIYLLALAEYRGMHYVRNSIPYRSANSDNLLFARTSSKVVICDQVTPLAVAYVPGEVICILPYLDTEERDDMLTPSVFVLQRMEETKKRMTG